MTKTSEKTVAYKGIGTQERGSDLGSVALDGIGTRISAAADALGSRKSAADEMGVSTDSLQRYIRGDVEPSFVAVARLALASGHSLHWIATGEGSPIGEPAPSADGTSQDLSEDHLTIALEIADDIIRVERESGRVRYVPKALFSRLVRLMYLGVSEGLPVAKVHDIGTELVRAANSSAGGIQNVGKSGLGGPGTGRSR